MKKENTAIVPADQKLEKPVNALVKRANEFVIKNDKDFADAANGIRKIDDVLEGEDIAGFENNSKLAHAAWQAALATLKKYRDPLLAAKKTLLAKRSVYTVARDRQQALLQEQANEKARQQQIEDAKKVAKVVAKSGDKEAARAIVETAKTAPVNVAPLPGRPKEEGFVSTTVTKWEIENEALLEDQYWIVDRVTIAKVVKALGLGANIRGVRVWEEPSEYTK